MELVYPFREVVTVRAKNYDVDSIETSLLISNVCANTDPVDFDSATITVEG
jgi:hypothetical protein